MLQKVAAKMNKVAADLCLMAREVRWLLMKMFFALAATSAACFCVLLYIIVMPYLRQVSNFVPKIVPKVCSDDCTLVVLIMIQVIRGAMRPILGTLNRIGVYGVILSHQILFRTHLLGVLTNPLI